MSDPPKTSAPFLFGAPAASESPGAFGKASSTPGGGIFGSIKPSTTSSLFGAASTTSGTPSFQNLGSTSNTGSSASPFGGSTLTGNTFGSGNQLATPGLQTPNKSSVAPTLGQTATSGFFGGAFSKSDSNPTTTTQPGSSTPATSKPTLYFSTTPAGPPPNGGDSTGQTFGLNFKNNQPQSKEQGSGLFAPSNPGQSSVQNSGANPFASLKSGQTSIPAQASTSTPTNLFGNAPIGAAKPLFDLSKPLEESNTAPQQGLLQAQNVIGGKSAGSSPFGNSAASKSSGSIFSNASKSQETTAQQSPFAQMKTPFSFPALSAQSSTSIPATQSSGASIFAPAPKENSTGGTSNATTAPTIAPSAPSFNVFNKQPAATSASTTSAPTTTTTTTTTTAAPSFNLFNKQSTTTSTPTTSTETAAATAPSFDLFKKQATTASTPTTLASASAATSSSNIFGGINKESTATTTSQPPTVNATTSGSDDNSKSVTNLGASAVGPRPPAQSRLKNKSMDEIITRWASDLSKYQKDFQKQAQQVADWDRMLVENSEKIQKLYASTLEAERANVEVERQLSAVEGDQAELDYWLEHYEKQVDDMLSSQVGQGDTLSGPDQERERTYKLAEKLSDRLDEMGKDLTSMIEEINDASSNLSKNSKADDPLSQIVRVLNGHLSQLQQIDQSTAALQAKVSAAQKASRGVGTPNGLNGLIRNDAADDFYRSYMGRR